MTECFYCGGRLGDDVPSAAREHPECSKKWRSRDNANICVRCGKEPRQVYSPRCESCKDISPYLGYPGAAA